MARVIADASLVTTPGPGSTLFDMNCSYSRLCPNNWGGENFQLRRQLMMFGVSERTFRCEHTSRVFLCVAEGIVFGISPDSDVDANTNCNAANGSIGLPVAALQ